MKLDVRDYVGKSRDSTLETKLAEQLREMDPDDAFAFIAEYVDHDEVVGLSLASRSLRRRSDFDSLLRKGFKRADASSIRFWLKCCVNRLGPRRIVTILREVIQADPEVGRKVFYWSRLVLLDAMPELRDELRDLGELISEPTSHDPGDPQG